MVTELNALKQAVAALTTKTDSLQTDVTNIKTDVGTIETAIAGIGGGSEPWENITDVFIRDVTMGTGGFVANKDIYMLCVPTEFDIGHTDPDSTEFWYYSQYGKCEVNGIAVDTTDEYHYPLPMGVKFKFKAGSNNTKNRLIIRNTIVFIYSK